VTIFLSTHSLAVAEELCTRIGVLDRGRLLALGTLDELRARAGAAPAAGPSAPAHGGNGAGYTNGASREPSLEEVFLDLVGAADGQW
jgi:ABC-2 type transport system ATP-binding protein